MEYISYLVAFLIVFNSVVFIHEYGHYLAAVRCGVKVVKFSIGMGPEIIGKTDSNGTRWCLSLLPVGGFVMMHGDNDASSVSNVEIDENLPEYKYTLQSKSGWQKMLVAFAGPFFNYLYAFIIFVFIGIFCGRANYVPIVEDVVNESIAHKAGLLKGDLITYVNYIEIKDYKQIIKILGDRKKNIIPISVTRDGQDVTLEARFTEKGEKFGIKSAQPTWSAISIADSFVYAFQDCTTILSDIIWSFKKLFSGEKTFKDFGGMIQIATVTGDALNVAKFGLFFLLIAQISLGLGFINLLPLPVLDGGTIIIGFIEQLIGKKLNAKVLEFISGIFAFLLIGLTIYITYNDIMNVSFIKKLIAQFQ